MMTTCPVCGTTCKIVGDPSSVTRWYEPVMQAELEAANKQLVESERISEARLDSITRHERFETEQARTAKARIVELEAAQTEEARAVEGERARWIENANVWHGEMDTWRTRAAALKLRIVELELELHNANVGYKAMAKARGFTL